jgi:hypothetical protein
VKKTNAGKFVALYRERVGQSQQSVWDSGLVQQYNEEGLKTSMKVKDNVSTEVFKTVICRQYLPPAQKQTRLISILKTVKDPMLCLAS